MVISMNFKKKNNFDKKYPILAKYITDELTQQNMLNNADLLRKYEANDESIKAFVFELDKYFSVEEARSIILETVLKYPDSLLLSFITSYLNSDEETKANAQVVSFYKRILSFGEDSIKYIEKHGIIADRSYRELPDFVIDEKYKKIKTGTEQFKGENLSNVYERLSYSERSYVVELLENHSYFLLNILFSQVTTDLKGIIALLIDNNIPAAIFKEEYILKITPDLFSLMIFMLIDSEFSNQIIPVIKVMLEEERYALVRTIITNNLFAKLVNTNEEEISTSPDEVIIEKLKSINLNLIKEDE